MKKIMSTVSIALSSALLLSMAAPVTAFAVGDEVTQKDVTAYLYSMEDSETLQCIFKSTMPDMPYISTVDFCDNIFKGTFTEEKNSDGTYTVSAQEGTMVINTDSDTLYFDVFESFVGGETDTDSSLDAPYLQPSETTIEGELNSLTLDFGAYDIDILEADGRTYMPLSSISLLFSQTYNAAEYANENIYFVHSSEIMTEGCYFDRTNLYQDDHRSREMIDLTYHELCFAMDKLYGRPAKAEVATSVEEKGFDKTLDEFSDETRRAKELMMSESKTDFIYGISYLASVFDDGGHTDFERPLIDVDNNFIDTTVGNALAARINDMSDPDTPAVLEPIMESIYNQQDRFKLHEQRKAIYESYETVNVWDDMSQSQLLVSGDTAVFVFDNFWNEAVDHFKWSLDYAKEKGIKRFVIDLSCNSGGSTAVVMYMTGMMCNKERNSNNVSMRTIQTITGNIFEENYRLDRNLDGEINDLDQDVYYDFEYAILTSRFSFSSANLLPSLARDNGIAVIGETSGGGACALNIIFTPEIMPYTLSGYIKFINKDNKDVDSGISPDYDLTNQIPDEYGGVTMDYSGMYNIAAYSPMIDRFYGITEEPTPVPTTTAIKNVQLGTTSYTYDGKAKTPTVTVTDENSKTVDKANYDVKYSKNTNAGTATVTVTGKGNYTGAITKTFTINQAKINTAAVTVAAQTYTGKALTPAPTVKIGSTTLKKGTDYKVTYSSNTKAGTAKVTITGQGNYTGTTTKTFKINAKSTAKLTAKLSATSYIYNGKAKTPSVTVKDGKTTLKKGTDYTVTYKNNTKPGKATVTIKGKGNYAGTITKTFTIKPKKATLKTATSPKTKQLKVTWTADKTTTGYQIQYSTSSKFTSGNKTKTITKNSTATATIKNLTKGKTYYVRIRAYKTIDGKKVYGAYSTVKKVKIK